MNSNTRYWKNKQVPKYQINMNYLCNTKQLPGGRKDYHSFSFSPEYLE
jgi:hypothetical protein